MLPLYISYSFAEYLTTKTGTFQNDEIFSAMSMLCFNIAWACLFRHLGMPVPRSGAVWVHASFLRYWRTVWIKIMNGVTRKNINCLMPNNMKQIKAHIAVSLDGFIATSDNELDWITSNVKSLIGNILNHLKNIRLNML